MDHVNDRSPLLASQAEDEDCAKSLASAEAASIRLGDYAGHPPIRDRLVSLAMIFVLVLVCGMFLLTFIYPELFSGGKPLCSTVDGGYHCFPSTARFWGQYSPFFSLSSLSEISPEIPVGCTITFAQILSRHGARQPTATKSDIYQELITRIQSTTESYHGNYTFLHHFTYDLGADELTPFGEAQLVNSGAKFYRRYQSLSQRAYPFTRAAGSSRVIASAELFMDGFQQVKTDDPYATNKDPPPKSVAVIIPEGASFNNTLDHSQCDKFESSKPAQPIELEFTNIFAPAILERVKSHLIGANITIDDIPYLMDMCPFHTVALTADASTLSPFCTLFTDTEWKAYDYLRSLGKYYAYGAGHPLGASQGIGFVNELISRLTNTPVQDTTSVNHTLDSDPTTFPLDLSLYADFSHDNTMLSIYTALGLYNGTHALNTTTIESAEETDGFSSSWIIPFGAMAYIEKMECDSTPVANEPLVRVLVNDRVVPLHGCAVDSLGRCKLDDFLKGLSFARDGGDWESCFT
ncbi:hypothetical protein AJ80_07795 [Polytolypa hystricis UAMH7299]|uniref:Phytase A n=1 Tax=Polytolypa hystricis (strain UAMH7299) TaxID=1447883 RepID=A0A2B7XJE6_POLH7|nr:hypothetical protein AJ80_07795 [Polytolypa hystricis UAMH7299]